ncbi:MAG TPA: hypothetical protein VIJ01_09275 [Candidatus Angelobacter sp.]
MPPTIERKLRIQFQKSIRHGYVKNACLSPPISSIAAQSAETGEDFIVRVDSKNGSHYWFSDRRVLREQSDGIRELLRYKAVQRVHWMFKDVWKDPRILSETGDLKRKYYDRLEIETPEGLVVLDGLEQAYAPILSFFDWIVP